MKLLALDTTEGSCSVALLWDYEISEKFQYAPRQHSALLLPMLDELLAEADARLTDMDALAFACGPGSFTGVRIAAAVIQALATATDLPVVPVSSLLALAQGAARIHQAQQVLAGFDARMQEVYWAVCQQDAEGLMQQIGDAQVCAPQEASVPTAGNWFGAGSAWQAYAEVLPLRTAGVLSASDPDAMVHAQDVVRLAVRDLASAVSAEQALPVYLRNQVATPKPFQGVRSK